MSRYVAFLDILGFKDTMKLLRQGEAENYILGFSSLLYNAWKDKGLDCDKGLKGFIVSDSVIIHTSSASLDSLQVLLDLIIEICRRCFSEKGIMLRCAISKGEYSHLDAAISFDNLKKGLIVGEAYIDAIKMESSSKTSAIIVSKAVAQDVRELSNGEYSIYEEKQKDSTNSLIKWLSLDYLLSKENLEKYCKIATQSNWLPVYYNTLYLCFHRENNRKKRDQILYDILSILRKQDESGYLALDKFIQNSFNEDVNTRYQQMFTRFLRECLTCGS